MKELLLGSLYVILPVLATSLYAYVLKLKKNKYAAFGLEVVKDIESTDVAKTAEEKAKIAIERVLTVYGNLTEADANDIIQRAIYEYKKAEQAGDKKEEPKNDTPANTTVTK